MSHPRHELRQQRHTRHTRRQQRQEKHRNWDNFSGHYCVGNNWLKQISHHKTHERKKPSKSIGAFEVRPSILDVICIVTLNKYCRVYIKFLAERSLKCFPFRAMAHGLKSAISGIHLQRSQVIKRCGGRVLHLCKNAVQTLKKIHNQTDLKVCGCMTLNYQLRSLLRPLKQTSWDEEVLAKMIFQHKLKRKRLVKVRCMKHLLLKL